MICVHPNLATNRFKLKVIQAAFGLRAELGDKYLRLVPANSTSKPAPKPVIKTTSRAMAHPLCRCSFCFLLTNTQAHGSDCKKCELGVMEALGGDDDNGGKAA